MKLLDIFSGIGGFSLGLERAGFETIAFCEIEDYPRKVLAKHWPDVPIAGDIRKLSYNRETQELTYDGQIIYRGTIDAICGGFPCQDISTAGLQAGISGERSGLYFEYCRLIGEIRPEYVFMENVTNLLNGSNGAWFGVVLGELAKIRYDAIWHCIPASSIGAPHRRDRVWVVCYPDDESESALSINDETQVLQKHDTNTNKAQLKGRGLSVRISKEHSNACNPCWGKDKPGVDRASDGISRQMDRLGCLGNAVVPQIPEIIGRAIMKYEEDIK